jgi:DNA-binding MurR/RpiR family transcriptional regulator
MDNCDIRSVLNRIRDHLNENDRLRLSFVLGDPDKISEKDVNDLIKLFEKINCDEAVKLLKGKRIILFFIYRMSQYTYYRARLSNP